jgi:tyrocidine synthetase III
MDKRVIHTVFEATAAGYPLHTAIRMPGREITYAALDRYANRLAHLLAEAGCRPGIIVQVAVPASIELVAALLAVFKSGALYVPVDMASSEERLRQVFGRAFDGIVIATPETRDAVMELACSQGIPIRRLVLLDAHYSFSLFGPDGADWTAFPFEEREGWEQDPATEVRGDSSSYIFYTSGSTGEAKAIEGTHAGLSHFIHWEIGEFGIDASVRVSQLTQLTFDASLRDIFVPLVAGGCLCIPSQEIRSDMSRLLMWIDTEAIQLLHCVPSLFRLFIRELTDGAAGTPAFAHLRYILLAGELLYAKDVHQWRKAAGSHACLVNLYGPTETTLVKTFYRIGEVPADPGRPIPVGRPITNTSIAIIRDGRLCQAGEVGEIYIKTPFATRGYYNNPELTRERFVQNPLHADGTDIVYRTGDLGRTLPDGNIEVLGRADDQVKVNGIRIELAEIERALLRLTDITGAAARVHRQQDDHLVLIGYYTGRPMDNGDLRAELKKILNAYAIPAWLIHLEEFPRNSNGKIDKKALPLPEELQPAAGDTGYAGEWESKVAALWAELLGHDKIGRDTSFFSAGGNSIRAIQLISRIHKRYGVRLKMADIFNRATVREMADHLSTLLRSEAMKIGRAPDQPAYALSPSQRRLWVLSQFEDSNAAYNLPGTYVFESEPDLAALGRAFDVLVERHESLRTVFREDEKGNAAQHILSPGDPRFRLVFRELREGETIGQVIREDYSRTFDLRSGPLLRATMIRLAEGHWVFTYVIHHIICDGWSMTILVRELLSLYEAFRKNEVSPLRPLRLQYRDFAVWQNAQLTGPFFAAHKSYWLRQLEGLPGPLELPADKPRPALKTFNGHAIRRRMPAAVRQGIVTLVKDQDATLFMGLLAAVNALFCRYTQQEDIIIGSPIAGRDDVELEDLIGFFVNNLVLRTRFRAADSFKQLLKEVRKVTIEAYEHHLYPFDDLVNDLSLYRDLSRNPLFDIQVIVQDIGISSGTDPLPFHDLKASGYRDASRQTIVFDMVFNIADSADGLDMVIMYNSDIYTQPRVERMSDDLERLLTAIIRDPHLPVGLLDFLSEEEKRRLLGDPGGETAAYPEKLTLVSLVREQAFRTPHLPALAAANGTITYRGLEEQCGRLAGYLAGSYGLGPGDLAGIMLDRSYRHVLAVLAVLGCGAAYVPIDPELPAARKEYIIRDTGIKALITQSDYLFDLAFYTGHLVAADIQFDPVLAAEEHAGEAEGSGWLSPGPDDLAYVIYTSGSTGRPKGVMIEHRSIVNTICAQKDIFGVAEGDGHLQFSSLSFDASVSEIFVCLASGGCLFVADQLVRKDPINLQAFLRENRIDIATIPPALLRLLDNDSLRSLNRLVTAGEAAIPEKAEAFAARGIYFNAYGPTEASICSTVFSPEKGRSLLPGPVPIGRPIPHTRVYLLNEFRQLMPAGAIGEICVAGAGLARGYWNNPKLTAEKFVTDPFREGERMYCTGDLGRWLPDGQLVFTGRKDEQVKISGQRVEPGEVESVLLGFPGIRSAVVTAKADQHGGMALLAYVVATGAVHLPDLRTYMEKQLPAPFQPGHYMFVDELPVTTSGKIDRTRLPDPGQAEQLEGPGYVAPGNEREAELAAIWEDVLEKERVGITDDYFALGGNSLKAILLIKRIADGMHCTLSMRVLFEERTIAKIAPLLGIPEPPGTILGETGDGSLLCEASYNELNYFSSWKIGADKVTLLYPFKGLDAAAFATALDLLAGRHEILRTSFVREGDRIMQKVAPFKPGSMRLSEPMSVSSHAELLRLAKENDREIDIWSYPLFELSVFRLGDTDHLFFRIHHSIMDGYSSGILKEELTALYEAVLQGRTAALPPLRWQYRDFTAWQKAFAGSAAGHAQREYWLQRLEGFPEARPLRREINPDEPALKITRVIDGEAYAALDRFARSDGFSKAALLLGALVLFQYRLSGMMDITVTVTVSGRASPHYGELDVSRLIGLFVNVLPVRTRVDAGMTAGDLLRSVQRHFLEDLARGEYPFLRLIEELPQAEPSLLAQTGFFNYHNYDHYLGTVLQAGEEDRRGILSRSAPMKRAFGLTVEEYRNCLQVELRIAPDLVRQAAEEEMKDLYFSTLAWALGHSYAPVSQLREADAGIQLVSGE